MKKSLEIPAHLIIWILFAVMILVNGQLYLEAKPDAPFAGHLPYVVFLDVLLGAVFFYTTYIMLPWARRKASSSKVLAAILLILLVVFALPAFGFGTWQVLSSVVPHIIMILLAILFRNLFSAKANNL